MLATSASRRRGSGSRAASTCSSAPRPSAAYGPSGWAASATAIAAACSGVSESGSVTGERDTVRVMSAMVASAL